MTDLRRKEMRDLHMTMSATTSIHVPSQQETQLLLEYLVHNVNMSSIMKKTISQAFLLIFVGKHRRCNSTL